jgi:DnaA family protein
VSPQLPLALRFPADQRFQDFIGSEGVRDLVAAVACGEQDHWLFLAGASGSGKTHLLLAGCAEAGEQRAMYFPLVAMAGRLEHVLVGAEMSGLVCLDGVEAIAGHREDEVALFHFHNRARAEGTRVIYAASAMPTALPLVVPDLASRLEQCTRLALTPLDEAGRREVLTRRASRRGLELDDAVLDYLFRRVGRDLGTLTALLDRLDRESLAAQRRITVPFLRLFLPAANDPGR